MVDSKYTPEFEYDFDFLLIRHKKFESIKSRDIECQQLTLLIYYLSTLLMKGYFPAL